ncbi:hypothetical protein [Neisseria sp. Ec49-e6-T10]|uniref:hypothetical protein n=1 Tax=Neisseria sp. Ec49-e6-T10 TaxID=3140744 RepID=UPI003EB76593
MISSDQLLLHLYKVLPFVTGRFFSKKIPLSAEINSDLDLVVTLSDTTGFVVGRHYIVREIDLINPVTDCVGSSALGWALTTEHNHRVTAPLQDEDETHFTVEGNWANQQSIFSVPNRQTVITRNGETNPFSGAIIEHLIAEDGYILCKKVTSTQVTFKLNNGYVYPCECRVGFVSELVNVSVVPDIERAKAHYTQKIKDNEALFAYLIMGDRNVIADKRADAGIIAENRTGKTFLNVTTAFNVLVFWPRNKSQEAARFQINEAYGAIQEVFDRVFFGYRFNRTDGLKIMPLGAGQADVSDIANFGFVYEYQALDQIETEQDGFKQGYLYYDVPTRDINKTEGQMYVSDGASEPQPIFSSVNLDEVPL